MGGKLYDTISDRAAPQSTSAMIYKEIVGVMKDVLDKKTYVLAERYAFQFLSCSSGELDKSMLTGH